MTSLLPRCHRVRNETPPFRCIRRVAIALALLAVSRPADGAAPEGRGSRTIAQPNGKTRSQGLTVVRDRQVPARTRYSKAEFFKYRYLSGWMPGSRFFGKEIPLDYVHSAHLTPVNDQYQRVYDRLYRLTNGRLSHLLFHDVSDREIAFDYSETNRFSDPVPLVDGRAVWPWTKEGSPPVSRGTVIDKIRSEKRAIVITMFGMEADAFGLKLQQELISAARRGVEVIINADKVGARMGTPWYELTFAKNLPKRGLFLINTLSREARKRDSVNHVLRWVTLGRWNPNKPTFTDTLSESTRTPEEKMFAAYREAGVKVLFHDSRKRAWRYLRVARLRSFLHNASPSVKGFFSVDHRKLISFASQGEAFLGGMTLQKPSAEDKRDLMVRVDGELADQILFAQLLAYRNNGGSLEALSAPRYDVGSAEYREYHDENDRGVRDINDVFERYFPIVEHAVPMQEGSARYVENHPGIRRTASETMYDMIRSARSYFAVLNSYIPDKTLTFLMREAAGKRGVRAINVKPSNPENILNEMLVVPQAAKMVRDGVEIYEWLGLPMNRSGKLHGKVFVNEMEALVGSLNGDGAALKRNRECMIHFKDTRIAKLFFDEVIAPSIGPQGADVPEEARVSRPFRVPTGWSRVKSQYILGNIARFLAPAISYGK